MHIREINRKIKQSNALWGSMYTHTYTQQQQKLDKNMKRYSIAERKNTVGDC